MGVPRLILIPGMGTDRRLLEPQRAGGLAFEVPDLPVPDKADSLPSYARRVARDLDLHGPCVLGGVSFGGMLACELAAIHKECLGVLLIASCRDRSAVPAYAWPIEWGSRLLPDAAVRPLGGLVCWLWAMAESLNRPQYDLVRDMLRRTPTAKLRRFGSMILDWKEPTTLRCRVHQIHGDRDRVLPIRRVRPDVVISGGGHLINLTHSRSVNSFISSRLESILA